MSRNSISDHLVNIRTFQTYLEHIVNSIESDRYHEETIAKLSDLITNYYKNINDNASDEEDNLVEIIDTSDNDSVVSNNSSTSDTTNSDSDSDIGDNNSFLLNSFHQSEPKVSKEVDKYLEDFTNGQVDNSNIKLYQKLGTYSEKLDQFIQTSTEY